MKIINNLRSRILSLKRFIVFCIGGGLGALLNWSITVSLTEFLGLWYLISYISGLSVNLIFNFLYHRSITFKNITEWKKRFAKFVILSLSTVLLSIILVYLIKEKFLDKIFIFRFNYLISIMTVTFIVTFINYQFNKRWVFSYDKTYHVNWKYKPFLFVIDLIGNILFYPLRFKKFNKENIKKILIIRIDEIGDVILTTPLFRLLKNEFPNTEINVLLKNETKELLRNNPYIDNLIICEKPWIKNKLDLNYYLWLIKKLRKERFDLVIELHTDPRNILLAFLVGKFKIGYSYRGFGFLLNRKMKYNKKHIIEQNLLLLKLIKIRNLRNKNLEIFITKKDESYITYLFRTFNINKKNKLICINPGTARVNKFWQNEKWAKLCNNLFKKYKNLKIIFTGNENEIELVENIINKIDIKKIINLTGKTSLIQLAALIKKCDLFIGPDTGPLHIARAVNIPLIGLFGPTDPAIWGYNNNNFISLYKKLDCSFCNEGDCYKNKVRYQCMKNITINDVLKELRRVLPYI
jgi:predicted lipopolysaccharide heptosyltransferase III